MKNPHYISARYIPSRTYTGHFSTSARIPSHYIPTRTVPGHFLPGHWSR